VSNQHKHNNLVDRVARRLHYKGYSVEKGYIYNNGELDIKVIRNGFTRYYEIKGRDSKKAHQHARNQMYKFLHTYPFKDRDNTKGGKCIYVGQRKDGTLHVSRYRGKED
jgi:hypothetical protein|tara:strand:+ start:30818 stop:31144 length:327 start_codon:yes stop_codon:yes gene_type:complete